MNQAHIPNSKLSSADPQWYNTPANAIAMVENNIGIVAASLVVMRPCFRFCANILHGRPGHQGLDNSRRRTKYKVSDYSRKGSTELKKLSGKLGVGSSDQKVKLNVENSMVSDEELLVRIREDYGAQYLSGHGSGSR